MYDRETLGPGVAIAGPALVAERQTTTNIPAGFVVTVGAGGALILEDRS